MAMDKIKEKFTEYFKTNYWDEKESVSGGGSTLEKTTKIRTELPDILRKYNINSMLDIPCGDFNWMKEVNLPIKKYIGADIVDELIAYCNIKYSDTQIEFKVLDLINDNLPKVDLIFCKDCLVHLPFKDGIKAIENIKKSGSKYLMTTNYPLIEANEEINLGEWRRINLLLHPYCLPLYIESIETGIDNTHLSLWQISDL
jgi:SAM-dependent methyltransferase